MSAVRRCALAVVPFVVAIVVYAVTALTRYDRLPARMATHFTFDGTADGFSGRDTALWSDAAILAGLGVLFAVLALVKKQQTFRLTTPIGFATAVMVGYPLVATLVAHSDVKDPHTVQLPLWQMLVALVLAVGAGALAWRLIGKGSPIGSTGPPTPSLPLAEGEAAVWTRHLVSRGLLIPSLGVALCGVVALAFEIWPAGPLIILAGLLPAAFGAVRVTVDQRGLTVSSTLIPRPRLTVPLSRITGARSTRVQAIGDFGGWGYRIAPGRRGVVLRSGEALSVATTQDREYVVTIDDSATAAALLNGLVERDSKERA
ncbi:DUF1648 domain-containing protein [Streptomyces sp. NPDC058045]|uniref:DUF1648 domain-containing protein n=1 Tax=Streptomyces sp. NPDC058045 TaxID=3346311 RepID=UPI0036E781CD